MARIHDLKEAYKSEWLAIEILKDSPAGLLEGELIYHSKNMPDVWKQIKGDKRRIYVTYAGPLLEEGFAAAF